jgi:hypothetical protein
MLKSEGMFLDVRQRGFNPAGQLILTRAVQPRMDTDGHGYAMELVEMSDSP